MSKKQYPSKMECVHCHKKCGVRPDVYEARIQKFGSEEKLLAAYTCRGCRKNMGVQADGEYKEKSVIKKVTPTAKPKGPDLDDYGQPIIKGTVEEVLKRFRDKMDVHPFSSENLHLAERQIKNDDFKGYSMDFSTKSIGEQLRALEGKSDPGWVYWREVIMTNNFMDKTTHSWDADWTVAQRKVQIVEKTS